MWKKQGLFLAFLKFLNSFVANNTQGVQFNKHLLT